MKLAYPAFSEPITVGAERVPCLVIENQRLFRAFLRDIAGALEGNRTDLVLSSGDAILDASKYAELLWDFVSFDLNRKSLIHKVIGELEKTALSPEHYLKTQELMAQIENAVGEWAFPFPCDVVPAKLSLSTLLRALGIELRNDYEGHAGEVEKILDYMELVREFDRDKLFITVNMRAFFEDALIAQFQKTALSHELKVLMLESQGYPRLERENRITIDADLCEF